MTLVDIALLALRSVDHDDICNVSKNIYINNTVTNIYKTATKHCSIKALPSSVHVRIKTKLV